MYILLSYITCCLLVALFFIIDAYINTPDVKSLPDTEKDTMVLMIVFSPLTVAIGIVILPIWGFGSLFFKCIEKSSAAGVKRNKKYRLNEKRCKLAEKYKNNPVKLVEEFEKLTKE